MAREFTRPSHASHFKARVRVIAIAEATNPPKAHPNPNPRINAAGTPIRNPIYIFASSAARNATTRLIKLPVKNPRVQMPATMLDRLNIEPSPASRMLMKAPKAAPADHPMQAIRSPMMVSLNADEFRMRPPRVRDARYASAQITRIAIFQCFAEPPDLIEKVETPAIDQEIAPPAKATQSGPVCGELKTPLIYKEAPVTPHAIVQISTEHQFAVVITSEVSRASAGPCSYIRDRPRRNALRDHAPPLQQLSYSSVAP